MNHKESRSKYVSIQQMMDMVDAGAFAYWQNMPMTRGITFSFERMEIRPQQFLSAFFKQAGEWLRRRNASRAAIWALEHPPGTSIGCHCLIHVPQELMDQFARQERRWMGEAGFKWRQGALVSERLCDENNKSKGPQSVGELLVNSERFLEYLLKGGEKHACKALRVPHQYQGVILGKRIGVSESISRAARDRAGYVAPSNVEGSLFFPWRCRLSNLPPSA